MGEPPFGRSHFHCCGGQDVLLVVAVPRSTNNQGDTPYPSYIPLNRTPRPRCYFLCRRVFFCSPSSVGAASRAFLMYTDASFFHLLVVYGTVVVHLLPVQYIMVRHCHHPSSNRSKFYTTPQNLATTHWRVATHFCSATHTFRRFQYHPGIGGTPASSVGGQGEASKTETKFFSS